MLVKDSSNAQRFLNCYNQIDLALRIQGDMKRSISYTEAIRKSARYNSVIRKYEEDLIDYGRLRNSIVHSYNDNQIIAEPVESVVKDFEKITKLITTPPRAIDSIDLKDVKCVTSDIILKDVLIMMSKTGYSNFPVYNGDMLVGVANSSRIAKLIGDKLYTKTDLDDFYNQPIETIVKEYSQDGFYTIVNKKVTIDKILNLFSENSKLLIVLITESGNLIERPIGLISVADIMDINKVMDNYSV